MANKKAITSTKKAPAKKTAAKPSTKAAPQKRGR